MLLVPKLNVICANEAPEPEAGGVMDRVIDPKQLASTV
jgi:hypothetical protein